MSTQPNLSRAAVLAGSVVYRLTCAAAWLLSLRHELQRHELEDGTSVPAINCTPVSGSSWWRFDAWTDGDCLNLKGLGWWGEVHYIPKAARRPQEAAGCVR